MRDELGHHVVYAIIHPFIVHRSSFIVHRFSSLIPPRAPAEAPEVHASPAIKLHSLALKHQALQLMCVAAAAEADLAARVDHPVPRDIAAFGQSVQRVADLPRMPLQSGQLGDLAVRRNAAAGNAADLSVDSLVS